MTKLHLNTRCMGLMVIKRPTDRDGATALANQARPRQRYDSLVVADQGETAYKRVLLMCERLIQLYQ